MGNSGYAKQDVILYHLNRREYDKVEQLLTTRPDLLEKPLTKDTKHTILMRAAFNSNLKSVEVILRKNPNINAVTPKGQTALGIAVKRNNFEIVQLLIEKGADVNFKNDQGFSVIDFAILPGYLNIARYIYQHIDNKEVKDQFEYEQIAKKFHYRYVNYKKFLNALKEEELTIKQSQYLTKYKKKLTDPVPDPRQSWKDWVVRNIDAGETPMVERNSLPEKLQPQNRKMGKLDIFFTNWTRMEGRRKVSYRPPQNREVRTELGDIQTNDMLNQNDPRDVQSAV